VDRRTYLVTLCDVKLRDIDIRCRLENEE
jgi:hypothetical protein